jgi:predicted phosphodiesterase
MKKEAFERILICSDHHGCYLDRRAWRVFLSVATEKQWDRVILNGDVFDFAQLSVHDRKSQRNFDRDYHDDFTIEDELFHVQTELFAPLRKAVGNKTKIQMRLGNHDARFIKASMSSPDALMQLLKTMRKRKSVYLEDVAQLNRWNIELSYNDIDVLYDTFTIIHGVKTSQNAAKTNLLTFGSGTSGHTHRANSFKQTMHGKLQGWWESGCMRTKEKVEYLPIGSKPDWSHAYLELHIAKSGLFFCIPHEVVNYSTIHDGVLYTG